MSGLPHGLCRVAAKMFVICGLLSGCSTIDYPAGTVAAANSQLAAGMRIAPGNTLKVTVFDEPNLSGEYVVDSNGNIALPLIGIVQSAGSTTSDLTQSIAAALSDGGYVLVPRVSVEVANYQPVFVLGEVNRPGEYPFTAEMNHLQVIAKAGGYTPRANEKIVILERSGWDQPRKIKLDSVPLSLAPGDTIIVEQSLF